MMPSLVSLLLCALLYSRVSVRPVYCVQAAAGHSDNAQDGMDVIDSKRYQRSVAADHQIDDILINNEQETESTTTAPLRSRDDHIWPNKIVYYTFSQTLSFNYRTTFLAAMNEWALNTCIQFHLAIGWQTHDHILFTQSEHHGCASYVGRKGGVQTVSMDDDCFSTGNALHLVGHAIGLWHEHTRPDRDSYIDVLYDNINETEWDNFEKISQEQFNLVPDIGYDVESVMHYSPNNFAKNGGETIRLREDAPVDYKHCVNLLSMGQRDQLSYLDKLRANKLYSCHEHTTSLEANGRNCVLPPPTSPPLSASTTTSTTSELSTTPLNTELPLTTTESSPITTSESPKCPFASSILTLSPQTSLSFVTDRRLKSGNIITLQLQYTDQGMRCAPKCRPKKCQSFVPESLCHTINFQFEIVAIDSQNSQKIRSGDKVALRSRCNPSKWIDCSGGHLNNECSITKCTRCAGSLCYDADFITPCKKHHFKVFGVGRQDGKVLNTHYQLYFRPLEDGHSSVVSCYNNNICKLSSGGNFTNFGEMLEDPQRFTFTILNET